jgi:hypothetical protein
MIVLKKITLLTVGLQDGLWASGDNIKATLKSTWLSAVQPNGFRKIPQALKQFLTIGLIGDFFTENFEHKSIGGSHFVMSSYSSSNGLFTQTLSK